MQVHYLHGGRLVQRSCPAASGNPAHSVEAARLANASARIMGLAGI